MLLWGGKKKIVPDRLQEIASGQDIVGGAEKSGGKTRSPAHMVLKL